MGTPVNSPPAEQVCVAVWYSLWWISHACMHVHTSTHACAHTHIYMHACMHMHTHTLVNCHRLSFTSVVNGPHSFPSHLCHCYLPATEREQGLCLWCNQQQQRPEGGHRPVSEMWRPCWKGAWRMEELIANLLAGWRPCLWTCKYFGHALTQSDCNHCVMWSVDEYYSWHC